MGAGEPHGLAQRRVGKFRRLVAACLAAGLTVGLLSSCSVPRGAVTGLSVDAAGRPVLAAAVCEGWLDIVVVTTGEGNDERAIEKWTSAEKLTGNFTLSLASPPGGWRTRTGASLSLRTNVTYSLSAGTEESRWSASVLDFTLADVQSLRPRQVLYEKQKQWGSQRGIVPAAEFENEACREFDRP